MSLSENQFGVLFALLGRGVLTQRELSERSNLSLGTVNATLKECVALGFVKDRSLTPKGEAALKPYRVDNAIIMAAGLSQRFAPISYEKPKGLLRVRGEILIERQILQMQEVGITDITVVVGYKKEYFFYLEEAFGVQIVVNDEYATRNNNGSLWVVRDRLANTYICSSDNYFTDNPFESHVYQAYYAAEFVDGPTDEWCIRTGPGNRIVGVDVGGSDSWVMLGQAYFDRAFSEQFRSVLANEFDRPETVDKLWERIYLDNVSSLPMVMRKYPHGVLNEFDSLDELREFDSSFIENVDSAAFDNIVKTLDASRADIGGFYPLKQGITNLSCHFSVDGKEYVYRHPGAGTEKMVDRKGERAALKLARRLGLDTTFLRMSKKRGWKISKFVPEARNLDPTNPEELRRAMEMARELHTSGSALKRKFDYIVEGMKYERILEDNGPIEVPGYFELKDKVLKLKKLADNDGFETVPSHNDFFPLNFLVQDNGTIDLIDWEYAGMSDEASDFGTFVVCSGINEEQANEALGYYFGRPPTAVEKRHFRSYVVFAGWCWYVWALAKESEGDDVGEWLYIYYRHAVKKLDELINAYEEEESPTATGKGA